MKSALILAVCVLLVVAAPSMTAAQDDDIKKMRDEEPVVTPNVEVTSEQIVVEDIDIPVEIKSDYPIQVEIENDDNWYNVREI